MPKGEHIIVFHELYFKLQKDQPMPVLCTLASNIVTHFEVSSTAALAKCFSPLKIFEVKNLRIKPKKISVTGEARRGFATLLITV